MRRTVSDPARRFRRFVVPAQADPDRTAVLDALRQETVGGALLLIAAVVALCWANSPWRDSYTQVIDLPLGPLTVHAWAADGLLAIFFYVAGLELKRELVTGSLRRSAEAVVPVVAAVAGMLVPALLFVAVVLAAGDRDALGGGRYRPPPTSRSPWPSSRSSARRYRPRSGRSC